MDGPDFTRLWSEKYRPDSLDEFVGRRGVVDRLKKIIEKKELPHLLFTGPRGSGKTTAALLLAREILGSDFDKNCKLVYASDPLTREEREDVSRRSYVSTSKAGSMAGKSFSWPPFIFARIKPFVELKPIGSAPFKILIIKDFGAVGSEQQGFRRLMERYSSSCRMILITDTISSVIDPIVSRCTVIFFGKTEYNAYASFIRNIASRENIKVGGEILEALYRSTDGKIGESLDFLQLAAVLAYRASSKTDNLEKIIITPEILFRSLYGGIGPTVRNLLRAAVKNDINTPVRFAKPLKFIFDKGYSDRDIFTHLSEECFNLPLTSTAKAILLSLIADIEFNTRDGNNDRLKIEYALLSIAQVGDRLGKFIQPIESEK